MSICVILIFLGIYRCVGHALRFFTPNLEMIQKREEKRRQREEQELMGNINKSQYDPFSVDDEDNDDDFDDDDNDSNIVLYVKTNDNASTESIAKWLDESDSKRTYKGNNQSPIQLPNNAQDQQISLFMFMYGLIRIHFSKNKGTYEVS